LNTKKIPPLLALALGALLPLCAPAQQTADPKAQETKPPAQAATPPAQTTTPPPAPEKKAVPPVFSYDPAGRRDPFKDLFGGQEVRENKRVVTRLSDMEIDEISIMGIVKTTERFEAIIAFADGFPMTLLVGQKLADGYVLSIEADKVVFRKTSERGLPLAKPRDIVKEFTSEEPAHE